MKLVRSIVREPLAHFLVIGAGLFLVFALIEGPSSPFVAPAGEQATHIVVTSGDVGQLAAAFEKTWLRNPTQEELGGLIDNRIREEVYYREALAMGLDRDDTIIRRRLRQKLEFLTDDIAALGAPSEPVLQQYMDDNKERFVREAQVAFEQVYVSSERHGWAVLDRAEEVLGALRGGENPDTLGDSLMVPDRMTLTPVGEVERLFGPQFAQSLLELEPGGWQGPVLSGYGYHLVRVSMQAPAFMPPLDEVRVAVEREWMAARKQELKDEVYARLLERYTVVVEQEAKQRQAELAVKPAVETGEKTQ